MPNPQPSDNFQIVTIRAKDEVLQAIRARSAVDGASLATAAFDLIAEAIAAPAVADAVTVSSEWDGTREGAVVFLTNVPDAWLIEELIRRFEASVGSADHEAAVQERDAALARAETAEGTLAAFKAQLKGLVS